MCVTAVMLLSKHPVIDGREGITGSLQDHLDLMLVIIAALNHILDTFQDLSRIKDVRALGMKSRVSEHPCTLQAMARVTRIYCTLARAASGLPKRQVLDVALKTYSQVQNTI